MPKEEKIFEKAQKILDRAENLFSREIFDRATKEFIKAADLYFKISEYRVAEDCYFYSAKALVHEGKYRDASEFMRLSANCCVLENNFTKAGDYYDISAKYALKSNKRDSELHSILCACFAYLCWFLRGRQDKGLAFIKMIKKKVDSKEFEENNLVRLVKGLTLAILNKDDSTLQVLERDFTKYKFDEAETKLIKFSFLIAKIHLLLQYSLKIDKKYIINDENLDFFLGINISNILELKNDKFLRHEFKSIKLKDSMVNLSENLSIIEKPSFPVEIIGQQDIIFNKFITRANFPGEAYIGPIEFSIEFDDCLLVLKKTQRAKLMIKSPPSKLGINLTPLTNPIINQTFLMEIKINNPSQADIVNIVIEFEFPKSLRLMRGTSKKEIYQLMSNEDFKWQLSLKPLEPGTHVIKAIVSFHDADGNLKGPNTAELPFEINL